MFWLCTGLYEWDVACRQCWHLFQFQFPCRSKDLPVKPRESVDIWHRKSGVLATNKKKSVFSNDFCMINHCVRMLRKLTSTRPWACSFWRTIPFRVSRPCRSLSVTRPCPSLSVTRPCQSLSVTRPCPSLSVTRPCPSLSVTPPCPSLSITPLCPSLSATPSVTELTYGSMSPLCVPFATLLPIAWAHEILS